MARQDGQHPDPVQGLARELQGVAERERETKVHTALRASGLRERERQYDEDLAEVTTGDTAGLFVSLGGPAVTVTFPASGGLLWVVAEVDVREATSPTSADVALRITGIGDQSFSPSPVGTFPSAQVFRSGLRPLFVAGGPISVELVYLSAGSGTTGFRNRRLIAGIF